MLWWKAKQKNNLLYFIMGFWFSCQLYSEAKWINSAIWQACDLMGHFWDKSCHDPVSCAFWRAHGPRLADSSFHFPPTAFLKKSVFRLFVVCTPICSNHPDTKIQKLSCESPYQTSRDTLLCQINCSVPLLFFFTCLCYIIHRRCHNFHGQS